MKEQIQQTITIKEVFERVVQLETKFDMEISRGRKAGRYFWTIMFILSFFQIATFIVHYLMYLK